MSSREADVLERQRQMANRLARSSSAGKSTESSNNIQDGKPRWKPPPPPGGPSKLQNAKGGGSSRSLASLTGVGPSSKKCSNFTPPARSRSASCSSSGGGTGSGSANDPILMGGRFVQRHKSNSDSDNNNGDSNTRPAAPPANTAEIALAQARERAGIKQLAPTKAKTTGHQASTTVKQVDKPNTNKASQLKRPTMRGRNVSTTIPTKTASSSSTAASGAGGGSGSLTSLLSMNKDTAKYLQPNAPKLLKHYAKIEPNDYWKNMMDWDFLTDLNDQKQKRNGNNGGGGNSGTNKRNSDKDVKHNNDEAASNNQKQKRNPLPDTFDSYREYCALWAPLCLDEARAQILSEAIAEIPYMKSKPEKSPVRVRLQPLKKDVNGSSETMGVQIKDVLTTEYKDRGFKANDIVLLMKNESCIWEAAKGSLPLEASFHYGLVGHIEYTRRSMEGLVVQVSRELWSEKGTPEMVLLKLKCNITSLREFTALCRMDSIPLLDYILGGKMSSKTKSTTPQTLSRKKASSTIVEDVFGADPIKEEKLAKKEILSQMGGSSALGKGFAEFASHKFNLSQLGAISASATEYGEGGFTLIKGPPGTGKTTTLCALLNALHIRQMNQYFQEVKKLAESFDAVVGKRASLSLSGASKKRPRILVCAPSNAAIDNVILKIMEDGFVDGNGCRYNPSIARIGRGQSASVKDVCLEEKVESYVSDAMDGTKLDNTIEGFKAECRRIHSDITKLRQRMNAIKKAADYPLARDWEIRCDEDIGRVYFVNHKTKQTTYEVPPPPEPGQRHFPPEAMPEYKAFVSRVVKMVERYNNISTKLERYSFCADASTAIQGGKNCHAMNTIRDHIETHILDSVHIVMTTLGTAGNRSLESANKFEVVVIDEAAQSVEPSTLAGLQLGSSHAILVGDPQQLPATIFNVSGKNSKYDRSLFQRLEEAGHDVHLLNTQYRMHPAISDFPRRIFYDGKLLDGPNVKHPEYGNPLKRAVFRKFQSFQSFTVLDLESSEERGGTSLANTAEAQLALHLFKNLRSGTDGKSVSSRVAVITPYAQQANLLRRTFSNYLGDGYERFVEVSSVDAFQGREANIVIFSCVRAAGSKGIGFLSDVRRMNVALTRAKYFLFVIARCSSITVNPYWRDLVEHARESEAVIQVPFSGSRQSFSFPDLSTLKAMSPLPPPQPRRFVPPAHVKKQRTSDNNNTNITRGDRGYQTK